MAIISDGAGQFAILLHGLCWVHAERLVHKLIPLNERHRQDQERVRGEIWDLYADLKAYRRHPDPALAPTLAARFDAIFTQRTSFTTLNQTLKRLHAHKQKLLLVLQRPDIVLHTNGSEGDIRGYVKWRKISGGTRSDLGRRCRDGFASLKKTCRKLGVSFWDYLGDRIGHHGAIAPLPDIIRERAAAALTVPGVFEKLHPIYFMDATHPQHNPVIGCGWIERGKEHAIKSNTGRRRLNINGAIDVQTMSAQIRFDDTIDAASTIALFEQIEKANPTASCIIVICDNARYYRSKAVTEYLRTSRIKLVFLPPYSPNLNLIERFWKFFKREVLYNRYYDTFDKYKAACKRFFGEVDSYAPRLRTLLTENFEIIGN